MKNIIFVLIALITCSCKAQTLETIALNDFSINNSLQFGDAPSQLTTLIGQPINTHTEYWEIGDVTATIYVYLAAEFEFVNNEFVGFTITNPQMTLQTNHTTLQVGNTIFPPQIYFPNSYNSKENGSMAINFGTGDYQYLLIKYDSNGKIIQLDHRIY